MRDGCKLCKEEPKLDGLAACGDCVDCGKFRVVWHMTDGTRRTGMTSLLENSECRCPDYLAQYYKGSNHDRT